MNKKCHPYQGYTHQDHRACTRRGASILLLGALLSAHRVDAWSVARTGAYIATGHGTIGVTPYRAAVAWDLGPQWRTQHTHKLHLFWEAAYSRWAHAERRRASTDNTTLNAITTGPQIRVISYSGWEHIRPYGELGIGFSWLSRSAIGGRRLGIHFQFEDRIGAGVFFGKNYKSELKLNIVHYSNASLHRNNSGINMYWIGLGRWF